MSRAKLLSVATVAAFSAIAFGAGSARADGYPPFVGYNPYFGGPTTYFRGEGTYQVTSERDGDFGFGERRYYQGGPFWRYAPTAKRTARPRGGRYRTVLRTRG